MCPPYSYPDFIRPQIRSNQTKLRLVGSRPHLTFLQKKEYPNGILFFCNMVGRSKDSVGEQQKVTKCHVLRGVMLQSYI